MSETPPLRMPTTVAQRNGIGKLASQAQERTVVLTNHGNAVAVVMSPAEYDNQRRKLVELEQTVLNTAALLVAERSSLLDATSARERLLAAD
jgi:PHD/YefM family antitoxin component YafN of YafNO toxin-antitoxin module